MEFHSEAFPELEGLRIPNSPLLTHGGVMHWRDKLPPEDPNPAPADGGVQSPTSEERAQARPNIDIGQRRNPWLHDGNLKVKPTILKTDLLLPNVQGQVEGDTLCLEPADYVPVSKSWGHCLLGFMAGRFPGRDTIERFTLTWPWPTRVAFHPSGWMVFRFETVEDMEAVKCEGNLVIFGTPLMLCSMPDDFNFDKVPEFKFKVWASLPGLQLELWQPSTLVKIASMVGTPIEVDHRTVARINIDGPRVHVLVDAKTPPPEAIKIRLPNGKVISQKIVFDFYPLYCTHCRRMGHSTSVCRQAGRTNPGPSTTARGAGVLGPDEQDWQLVQRRGNRYAQAAQGRRGMAPGAGCHVSRPPNGGNRARSTSRAPHRNPSRPRHANTEQLRGEATGAVGFKPGPVSNDTSGPTGWAGGAIPSEIHNAHTHIPSPSPGTLVRLVHPDPMLEER